MSKNNDINKISQEKDTEIIIRQHRRWTHWLERNKVIGEGNLILTNRRLLFLHRIVSTPDVSASIKELADAPLEAVLDHALTLHKNSYQVPLSSIMQVGVITLFGFPLPRFCLEIVYLKGKKLDPHTADFKFKTSDPAMMFMPQLFVDLGWQKAIRKAIQQTGRLKTK